jgi:tRNA threonylcarbamoyladenosine biosynthesis protein TsaB
MSSWLLALDTSTEAVSVALLRAAECYERFELAGKQQAQRVLPMIDEVLAEAGVRQSAIGAIAVGRGPGAFTGVRLGISVAQGIALGLDVPVLPISSLAAMAAEVVDVDPGLTVLATIDARMGEVYCGCYRHDSRHGVQLIGDECVGPADRVPLARAERWGVIGTGWRAYPDYWTPRIGAPEFADGERYPRASRIAQLAVSRWQRGQGVAPEFALPAYLRDKVALTEVERGVR